MRGVFKFFLNDKILSGLQDHVGGTMGKDSFGRAAEQYLPYRPMAIGTHDNQIDTFRLH